MFLPSKTLLTAWLAAVALVLPPALCAAPARKILPQVGDPAAADFMMKCAGCHTIGRGKLTGPDLKDAAAWKPADLMPKIKTMEKKVGPLTEEEVTALAKFLKDPKVDERIIAQEARLAAEEEAKYEKGNANKGADLFYGRVTLTHGGLACASCHRLGEWGGAFGPNLSGTFAKMGMTPLISACEKTQFREMDAAYRGHPITHQEAIHLAKFLETGKPSPAEDPAPNQVAGAALVAGLLGLGGISAYYRKKKPAGRRNS